MKLKKIKLAGFKSFIEPTSIQLQSNLTGIVGPNGCGKSNIIDAVRWVMGEISAKQLRGGSMADIIFNGSSVRKPAGKAAVEIIFDNTDASLGGEYAKYNEIAIRREVDRNGCSDYFLNDTSCRRKDIIDIFLGTGLGPRSYAIIEQGMIAKIIEAKPEDLRIMIEEAAGISKYKERRRETELRIKHTKENLLRIADIRGELARQLKTLKTQAGAAEKYKKLKQEERLTKAQIQALHWQLLQQDLLQQEQQIHAYELQLTEQTTNLSILENQLIRAKQQRGVNTEKFNQAQASYYNASAEVVKLEQQVKYIHEHHERLTKDLTQIKQAWQEALAHQAADQRQVELLNQDKIQLAARTAQIKQELLEAQQELSQAEQQREVMQQQWDNFTTNAAQIAEQLSVEQTKLQHLQQQITQTTNNVAKFNQELNKLNFDTATKEVTELSQIFTGLKTQHDELHNNLSAKQQQITKQRELANNCHLDLDQIRSKLQRATGERAALEVLQQAALGKNDAALIKWLKVHQLEHKPRLAQILHVATGWERAVEVVLGTYLEAVCVDDIAGTANLVNTLTNGDLILVDSVACVAGQHHPYTEITRSHPNAVSLASKITTDCRINHLLRDIYAVEQLEQALLMRANLNECESVITADGIWLAKSWIRVAAHDTKPKTGVLKREKQLQELNQVIEQEQATLAAQSLALEQQKNQLLVLEQEYQELQQRLRLITKEYSEAQGKLSAKQVGLQHLREREHSLLQQIKLGEQNLQLVTKQLVIDEQKVAQLVAQKTGDDQRRITMTKEREQIGQQLTLARNLTNQKQQELSHSNARLHGLHKQLEQLTQNLVRIGERIASVTKQQNNLELSLSNNQEPLAGLMQKLQLQQEQCAKLADETATNKQQISHLELALTALEQQYSLSQAEHEKIRDILAKLHTGRAELQVRSSNHQEQITELAFNLDELITGIPTGATISLWEEQLIHLSERIARLGLINLAAIAEFEQLSERKNYLDSQDQDLVGALNTLEEAIRTIDHETKDRFKEAYESINRQFQALFPKIFNGGKAYLEQNSQNLLETGILIMAQPPGKRNASIQLLSGGEKTLTAIALIFAIFELTPAPFCLLDEVDAPLDDANVSRFCHLVTEMAKMVQFIFITHNKLTMEIANQLVGITMQEAGVSRIVTVDLDTAAQLAGAE